MKPSNKQNVAVGTLLLLLAAFFSIALILQPLDFGAFGPEKNTPFYRLGNILYSVYGISSVLIPLFLFVAAIHCFASKWTTRKSMRLLTAVIPFFTSVVVEKICRIIKAQNSTEYGFVKIMLAAIIGFMLVTIEFLAAGIIADKITGHETNKKSRKTEKNTTDEDDLESADKVDDNAKNEAGSGNPLYSLAPDTHFSDASTVSTEMEKNRSEEDKKTETDEENASKNDSLDKDEKEDDPFEGVFDNIDINGTHNDAETDALYETGLETILEHKDNGSSKNNVNTDAEKDSNFLKTAKESDNADSDADFDDSELYISNPASLISQEEFDALTNFDRFDNEEKSEDIENSENETGAESEENNDAFENNDFLEWPETSEIMTQSGQSPSLKTEMETEEDEETEPDSLYEDSDDASPDALDEFDEINDPYEDELNEFDEFDEADGLDERDNLDALSDKNAANEDFDALSDENATDGNTEQNESLKKNERQETEASYNNEDEIEDDEIVEPVNIYEYPHSTISSSLFDEMEKDISDELDGKKYTFSAPEESREEADKNNTEGEHHFYNDDTESKLYDQEEAAHHKTAAPREMAASTKIQAPSSNQNKPLQNSSRAAPKKPYIIPSSLLEHYANDQYWIIDEETKADSIKLKETLNQFGIEAEIIGIKKGPVVTMFELSPAPGVKLSKIVALQDNIALNLAASSVRIVAPIPGRAAVGIEVPNKNRSIVSFREMIEQKLPEFERMAVPVVLGKDILGKPQVLDLVKTPHMLIAGATGAGKSVCVNSMILSVLYKRSPKQVKLILIDPKVVELKLYNDIPHLLTPVITEPKRALQSLQYCLCEMERRYALLDNMGVRDIASYNRRIDERNICTEKLPYIIVIIDEFADLMATTGKELESTIARLAAMSRAVGIHLVLATQRPSIDVITGLIKANIPTRIAFMVASKMDSRIIIDQVGAEMLLGKGDMLYASAVDPFPVRIQGTFVSDQDVENVVEYVKTLGEPDYIDDEIFVDDDDNEDYSPSLFNDGPDPLYDQALDIVIQAGKASASYIQRRLKIGYNRAARLVEEMEERGIVGPANGSKPREVIHVPS